VAVFRWLLRGGEDKHPRHALASAATGAVQGALVQETRRKDSFVQPVSFLRLTSQQITMSDPATKLCERARAGDLEAASELVAQFYERIFAWFRRLTAHEEDAADLTQKTFCKVWSSLASYQGRSGFSTWLHGIGHHVYVDWRRQKNITDQASDEWWLGCADDAPSPSDTAGEREEARQLYSLVERLDEDSRQTVHLHYYQGLSIAETAEALGIATSTVKYRLREAIEHLKARSTKPGLKVH
jgi:RNA polymerase sigma-70 factor (ECF subfamily)